MYEHTFGRLLGGAYRAVAADVLRAMATRSPGVVVDVGAGPGGLVVAVAAVFPDAMLCAVDVDPQMVALARDRVAREALGHRVDVLVGDVCALPLADGFADLVISTFSVHHWPDARRGFAEVRRILRPGGRALVYDLPDWWGRLETKAPPLLAGARAGGLDAPRVGRLPWPGPLPLIARLDATSPASR
jgi:ubiquinone/menaquinone biosynthesis C-methylase UbiE